MSKSQLKTSFLGLILIPIISVGWLIITRPNPSLQVSSLCRDYELVNGTEPLSWEEFKASVGDGGGVYHEFRPVDLERTSLIGFNTFHAQVGEMISYKYRIYYPKTSVNQDSLDIRYLVLVNEIREDVILESTPEKYYDIMLDPGEEADFQVILPQLSPGIYDIIVLGIPNFLNSPSPNGDYESYSLRQTLVVGNISNFQDMRHYTTVQPEALLSGQSSTIDLMLTVHSELVPWNYPENSLPITSRERLQFSILVGFPIALSEEASKFGITEKSDVQSLKFGLVTFLDYEQVTVTNTDENVFYGEIDNDTAYARIQAQLDPIALKGEHQLVVVRIDNPGRPQCVLTESENSLVPPSAVALSRVAVSVAE